MVKLTRIYTHGGDKGKTSLGDGSRVSKNDLRINAIGAVDEVNAAIGVVKLYVSEPCYHNMLACLQHDLFDLGADLCLPYDPEQDSVLRMSTMQVRRLEQEIDAMNKQLAPLNSFVLPGGTVASSYIHLARTITRRAERILCALHEISSVNIYCIQYLNRLSDYMFVMGRYFNDKGNKDILWVPGLNQITPLDTVSKADLMDNKDT